MFCDKELHTLECNHKAVRLRGSLLIVLLRIAGLMVVCGTFAPGAEMSEPEAKPAEAAVRHYALNGCAYRLALGDATGDGRNEIMYGAYEGAVGCLDPEMGEILWKRQTGGFPFAVETADLRGARRVDTYAACADGALYAFGPDGGLLWTFQQNEAPLYALTIHDGVIFVGGVDRKVYALDRKGQLLDAVDTGRMVNFLAVDEDGVRAFTRGPEVTRAKFVEGRFQPAGGESLPDGFVPFSMDRGDIDGNGGREILLGTDYQGGSGVLAWAPGTGTQWKTQGVEWAATGGFERRGIYCMTLVRVAEVFPDHPGPEIVAATSGVVRIFDSRGQLLGAAAAPVAFNDLVVDGHSLYLGSSPNGDNTLYQIDLRRDWESAIRGIRRQNLALEVGGNLRVLARQAVAASPDDRAAERGPYVFKLPRYRTDHHALPGNLSWMRDAYASDNAEVITFAGWEIHDREGPRPLLQMAAAIEEGDTDVLWTIAHGTRPHIRLETLSEALGVAPRRLQGFISHENESPALVPPFYHEYIRPVADLALAHQAVLLLQNKNVWWFSMPPQAEVFDALFSGERGRALIMGTDDANSRTPEINLLARVGLRQARLADHFQASVIGDMFSYNRIREWEQPKTGSPMLRLLVAHTVLGADWFFLRDSYWHGNQPTEEAREYLDAFLPLLRKGIVFAPKPEAIKGLASIGFAVHPPSPEWMEDAHNGHRVHSYGIQPPPGDAVLPRNAAIWGNSPTPDHALTGRLFRKRRQFGTFVPPTPFGLPVFVPAQAGLSRVVGVEDWWHTDGTDAWREGGPRLRGKAAADAVEASFSAAAESLLVRTTGDDVFCQTLEVAAGRYRIFLIDPGWLDPAERKVRLLHRFDEEAIFTDRLTGETIDPQKITIPAGSLRILDVVAGPPEQSSRQ